MLSGFELLVLFWGIVAIWLVWIEWSYQSKMRRIAYERERHAKYRKARGIDIWPDTPIHYDED